jgi:hypothetical protein
MKSDGCVGAVGLTRPSVAPVPPPAPPSRPPSLPAPTVRRFIAVHPTERTKNERAGRKACAEGEGDWETKGWKREAYEGC